MFFFTVLLALKPPERSRFHVFFHQGSKNPAAENFGFFCMQYFHGSLKLIHPNFTLFTFVCFCCPEHPKVPYLLLSLCCYVLFSVSFLVYPSCISPDRVEAANRCVSTRRSVALLLLFLHLSKREQRPFDVYAPAADPIHEGGGFGTLETRHLGNRALARGASFIPLIDLIANANANV